MRIGTGVSGQRVGVRGFLLVLAACLTVATAGSAPVGAQAADPAPFGLTCESVEGVRFCPGNGTSDRVPSWDGVPIDVDVTLPASGNGPWPTIVLLHGLGGDKTQLQPNTPQQEGVAPRILPELDHYTNLFYAAQGYATVALTLRGFGESCGGGGMPGALLQPSPCDQGFVRIADTRYEARDVQHLLGILVDQGITDPAAIGTTGFSYGGGIALQLAYLRDRVRCPGSTVDPDDPCAGREDGAFVPWTSPAGTPVSVGAAAPQWLWSDLVASLLPNGRFLDDEPATATLSREPIGVLAQSYVNALMGLTATEGYIVAPQPPGSPLAAWDLTSAVTRLNVGEPYGDDVRAIVDEYHEFHSAFSVPGVPAPVLLESGWNDDLFPVSESLRVYQDLRDRAPDAKVAMLLGSYGHGRDANKPATGAAFNRLAFSFFEEHLRGVGSGPAAGEVIAYTTTCPPTEPPLDDGPFTASSWEALHPDTVTFGTGGTQTVSSLGGDPLVGQNYDPIWQTNPLGAPDPCKTIDETTSPGTATATTTSDGFTLMGRPTISADVTTTGTDGQLVGRLWHVLDDGQQRLVTRGVYRLEPDQSGPLRFQLNGNGYTVPAGDTVKLELAPSDSPQYRTSNAAFEVVVAGLTVDLPVLGEGAEEATPGPTTPPNEPPADLGPPMPATGGGWGLLALGMLAAAVMAQRLPGRWIPVGAGRATDGSAGRPWLPSPGPVARAQRRRDRSRVCP